MHEEISNALAILPKMSNQLVGGPRGIQPGILPGPTQVFSIMSCTDHRQNLIRMTKYGEARDV